MVPGLRSGEELICAACVQQAGDVTAEPGAVTGTAVLRPDDLIESYELREDIDRMSGTTAEREYAEALDAEIGYELERDGRPVLAADDPSGTQRHPREETCHRGQDGDRHRPPVHDCSRGRCAGLCRPVRRPCAGCCAPSLRWSALRRNSIEDRHRLLTMHTRVSPQEKPRKAGVRPDRRANPRVDHENRHNRRSAVVSRVHNGRRRTGAACAPTGAVCGVRRARSAPASPRLDGEVTAAGTGAADLSYANLSYANLSGANLGGSRWDSRTLWPKERVAGIREVSDEQPDGSFRVRGGASGERSPTHAPVG